MTFTPSLGPRPLVEDVRSGPRRLQVLRPNTRPIKILHIINDLSIGGAEMMLYKLLSEMDRERFDPVVISLVDRGRLRDRIEALGIPVYTTGMKPGRPTPASIWRLIRLVRRSKPDLLQGWMYHGSLAAQVAGLFPFSRIPVLWSIHNGTVYSLAFEKRLTAAIIKLCAPLSRRPAKIIYVSQTSKSQHEVLGYCREKSCVIRNGFDTSLFTPSAEARAAVRLELGLAENAFLVGLVGRYHPQKDHANFLHAAALLLKEYPGVQFVLSGRGVDLKNHALCDLIQDLGIAERIHLLGERSDMPRLTASLDLASLSSSYGESFPNTIGEAMACGVPCVVTDLGDSAWMIGETGRVVPPRNPKALADAWKELIEIGAEGRRALGEAARARVIECFPLESIVAQYEAMYGSVIADTAAERIEPHVRYHRVLEHLPTNGGRQDADDGSADVRHSASSRPR
jgi:glycosyltransferase involved in cell wall biosynthesis